MQTCWVWQRQYSSVYGMLPAPTPSAHPEHHSTLTCLNECLLQAWEHIKGREGQALEVMHRIAAETAAERKQKQVGILGWHIRPTVCNSNVAVLLYRWACNTLLDLHGQCACRARHRGTCCTSLHCACG